MQKTIIVDKYHTHNCCCFCDGRQDNLFVTIHYHNLFDSICNKRRLKHNRMQSIAQLLRDSISIHNDDNETSVQIAFIYHLCVRKFPSDDEMMRAAIMVF